MVTRCGRKLKAPVVRQKSFELERKGGRLFQADQKRGQMDYPLHWRGNSSSSSIFSEKTASQYRAFETALSSLDFVYRKLLQTRYKHLKNPPKMMK